MKTRHFFALAATLTLISLLGACGARSDADTRQFMRTPEGVASVRVERAREHAKRTVTQNEWLRLPVRYNPTHCGSPPWEAHLYGAWRRVVLRPTPSTSSQKMNEINLRALNERFQADDGWNYPVLQWRADEPDSLDQPLGQ